MSSPPSHAAEPAPSGAVSEDSLAGGGRPRERSVNFERPAMLGLMALLWAQLYYACTYGWRFGEYYDYGWYVPPLLALCLYRRSREWHRGPAAPPSKALILIGAAVLFSVLAVVRSITRTDPRWTLPLWVQAAVVVGVSLWLVHRLGGPRAMLRSVPVWIFACSAIPLPTAVERAFIGHLTDWVLVATSNLLEVIGYPVKTMGDQLEVAGEMVHVTEGCSGIRSAQSFLMVSLFFGEWLRLRPSARIGLILAGFVTAWVFNTLRATGLAVIRVEGGELAFDEWHDSLGYIASILGAGVLYLLALMIDRVGLRRRRIRKIKVERVVA